MNDDELHPTHHYGRLEDNPGVAELVEDMKRLREDYGAETVSVSVRLPEGMQKVSLTGDLLSFEREDGWAMIVNPGSPS